MRLCLIHRVVINFYGIDHDINLDFNAHPFGLDRLINY